MNESYEISEDPIGLFYLNNTSADAICDAIKGILIHCSLPLSLCRAQAYNVASNMQGCRKGVATLIKHESPSALSVHCFAHKLNLQVLAQPDNTGVAIKPLCLTCWTARRVAVEVALKDYKILLETLEEIN